MSSWRTKALLGGAAFLAMTAWASAQTASHSHMHHEMAANDTREMVQFPPDMQTNFLGNMRDHLQTLNDIVVALAKDDYTTASKAAAERLGLDSPSAAGCKQASQGSQNKSNKPMTMDEMMEAYMPEPMRSIGLSMHTAASEFAKVAIARDRVASMAALSQVTQNCVSCHSAYRLR